MFVARRLPRLAGAAVAVAVASLIGGSAAPAGGAAPISAADLVRLELRVAALTSTAERARDELVDAAADATDVRIELDRLADKRDAEQDKVDAAIVELYQQSELGAAFTFGPSLEELNPAFANISGAGIAGRRAAIEQLDEHASTLGAISAKAERFRKVVRAKAKKVYDAQDEALTLLGRARAEYERQARAADIARLDELADKLRDLSDEVTQTSAPGVGYRGKRALAEEAPIIDKLNAAGSGYPEGYRPTGQTFDGTSSWYGPGFEGNPTASGAPFDPEKLTCAMKIVPLGTVVRVSRAGRAVNLLVNDRGPYVGDRIIDVSRAGARTLGFSGVAEVHIEVLAPA